ncbi:hypothetical protein DLJ49_20605 [Rhodovulum sp. 12E13]|uniref:hypothetical protein n=1 Tax=Rhodovulum sp. 12E13 TaxID=2203891 RepID=UPI000E19129E|nr:hypothetical protein [Rhodovulum sp. 12E13]RDC68000.1 hypothetical protein DLJ49_20605 [Rhodovulum sp. 12E13]
MSEEYCPEKRAADKAEARAQDESDLASGAVSPGELARLNGGGVRNVRHVGPADRIRRLAKGRQDS